MAKFHSVTISFKPESIHLYQFLKSKDNMSAYILRLISKDMEQENNDNLKHEIKEILLALLNESDMAIKTPTNIAVNTLNDSDIDIINDYF